MVNEQLSGYVRQQLASGVSRDEIRKTTIAAGWQSTDVDLVLNTVVTENQTVSPPIQAPAKVLTAPTVSSTSSKNYLVLILVGVAVLIIIGGGVAYAYIQNIGPFSVTQYTEGSLLTDVLAKSSEINTVSYALSASLAVDPREQGAVAFVVPPVDTNLDNQYQNDSRRVSDISTIVSGLKYKYGDQQSWFKERNKRLSAWN